jgi:putative hydrolase of the HAD superfamily
MSAFYLDQCCKKTEVMPHALETLDYLKTRYTLHIVSNGFTEVQYRKIERSGLDTYFTHVFLSEETGFHKPKPEFFDHVFSKIDATKEESLMIGDNYEADIEGAMNFGIDQVFYSLNPSDTPQRTPTYRIHDLAELRLFL